MKGLSPYYAQFEQPGVNTFRLDTRIYLIDSDKLRRRGDGECVAAVVAKNPGKAKPEHLDVWEPLKLDGDATLPLIRNLFLGAYQKSGKNPSEHAYVLVWNLFYLCNQKAAEACSTIRGLGQPIKICDSETTRRPKIVWFAWGKERRREDEAFLNSLKPRFPSGQHENSFYFGHMKSSGFNRKDAAIQLGTPGANDFAKHPLKNTAIGNCSILDQLASML